MSPTRDAFRALLGRLPTEPDVVIGFVAAYAAMTPQAREAQLSILEEELASLSVLPAAVYIPLLSVEDNVFRREHMSLRAAAPPVTARAFRAVVGPRRIVLVTIPYLDFCTGLVVTILPKHVESASIPLSRLASLAGEVGFEIEPLSIEDAIDALSIAVLRHPEDTQVREILLPYIDLFGPKFSGLA
jgi:hypothetical protein